MWGRHLEFVLADCCESTATWGSESRSHFGPVSLDSQRVQSAATAGGRHPPFNRGCSRITSAQFELTPNDATVTLLPIGGVKKACSSRPPTLGSLRPQQPVTIDFIANHEVRFTNRQIDPSSVGFDEQSGPLAHARPHNGIVTFNPITVPPPIRPTFGMRAGPISRIKYRRRRVWTTNSPARSSPILMMSMSSSAPQPRAGRPIPFTGRCSS